MQLTVQDNGIGSPAHELPRVFDRGFTGSNGCERGGSTGIGLYLCRQTAQIFFQSLWDGNGRGFILVVPDEDLEARPVSHSIYAAMTEEPLPDSHFRVLQSIRDGKDESISGYDTLLSKAAAENENAAMYAVIVFPLYYLALVLTMVSTTILTIQQISESSRYRRQFELLQKLGMDPREMKRALSRQFAIYYAMPVIPPLVISFPFLLGLGSVLDPGILAGLGELLAILGITFGLFFFLYLIYILLAYTSLRRNVLPPF